MEITPVVSFNANTPEKSEGQRDEERHQETGSEDEKKHEAKDKRVRSKRDSK